ncbi:MAG TPA: hypothetical protein VGL63_02925 [Streptosporangiaceae bacterium]|jgi:hypothetical protein
MQSVADGQEIPSRELVNEPAGAGTGWTVQVLPFQDQACSEETFADPTAVQLAAAAQETDVSRVFVAPGAGGTGWTVHELAALATPQLPMARAAAIVAVARLRRMIGLLLAGNRCGPRRS